MKPLAAVSCLLLLVMFLLLGTGDVAQERASNVQTPAFADPVLEQEHRPPLESRRAADGIRVVDVDTMKDVPQAAIHRNVRWIGEAEIGLVCASGYLSRAIVLPESDVRGDVVGLRRRVTLHCQLTGDSPTGMANHLWPEADPTVAVLHSCSEVDWVQSLAANETVAWEVRPKESTIRGVDLSRISVSQASIEAVIPMNAISVIRLPAGGKYKVQADDKEAECRVLYPKDAAPVLEVLPTAPEASVELRCDYTTGIRGRLPSSAPSGQVEVQLRHLKPKGRDGMDIWQEVACVTCDKDLEFLALDIPAGLYRVRSKVLHSGGAAIDFFYGSGEVRSGAIENVGQLIQPALSARLEVNPILILPDGPREVEDLEDPCMDWQVVSFSACADVSRDFSLSETLQVHPSGLTLSGLLMHGTYRVMAIAGGATDCPDFALENRSEESVLDSEFTVHELRYTDTGWRFADIALACPGGIRSAKADAIYWSESGPSVSRLTWNEATKQFFGRVQYRKGAGALVVVVEGTGLGTLGAIVDEFPVQTIELDKLRRVDLSTLLGDDQVSGSWIVDVLATERVGRPVYVAQVIQAANGLIVADVPTGRDLELRKPNGIRVPVPEE